MPREFATRRVDDFRRNIDRRVADALEVFAHRDDVRHDDVMRFVRHWCIRNRRNDFCVHEIQRLVALAQFLGELLIQFQERVQRIVPQVQRQRRHADESIEVQHLAPCREAGRVFRYFRREITHALDVRIHAQARDEQTQVARDGLVTRDQVHDLPLVPHLQIVDLVFDLKDARCLLMVCVLKRIHGEFDLTTRHTPHRCKGFAQIVQAGEELFGHRNSVGRKFVSYKESVCSDNMVPMQRLIFAVFAFRQGAASVNLSHHN